MKIITINVNGIRSAAKKKFFDWISQEKADFICLQEVRAPKDQLTNKNLHIAGYDLYSFEAQKKGYSGVAIYSKHTPNNIIKGLGSPLIDNEGRYIQLDFNNLKIASIYLPSGTSGNARQEIKYDCLKYYQKILSKQLKESVPYIICGDFNIAHNNIDLKNWRANQKHSGFLPEERAWLDVVFDQIGFVDAYRFKNPDKAEYTWWSNFANSWVNNVGWRIDYQVISPQLKHKIISTEIYRQEKFSDHAPLIINYDFALN
jgi:exodeoxyribonuclease-3